MEEAPDNELNKFLHPTGRYRGEFSPENLAFNANLQEFASRIGLICSLETNGKLTPEEAYKEIRILWKKLKESKSNLLDASERPKPELPPEE